MKCEIFDELEEIAIRLQKRRDELQLELSTIDKEVSDINHYIEFNSLNASRGYIMAKMLKDRFERRRNVKYELEALNKVITMQISAVSNGKARSVIEKVSNKKYTPRILKELFNEDKTKS